MKRILPSVLIILFYNVLGAYAEDEHHVSTEITKKHILLEEYTGIYCGNCPEGDAIAHTLLQATPEAHTISIHAGYYAEPRSGAPDYRIDGGEEIVDYFNVTFYPSGAINRRVFDGTISEVLDRSYWIQYSKTIAAEDAPVNLYLSSTYDGDTRELTIHVEGYFTAEEQMDEQELTILWTQDNIVGFQNGSTTGDNYNHMHMLRGFVTPTWGEELDSPKQGEYFEKDYSLTLPEDVKEIEVKAEDIEIIAFVTNGKSNVLNATATKPVYDNFDMPLAGVISEPKIPISSYYGYNFFEVELANKSNHAIETATFDIEVNGTHYESEWNGAIVPFGKEEIMVACNYEMDWSELNSYKVTLVKINGEEVDESSLEGTFSAPQEATPVITVNLKTNREAAENHYYVKDEDGNIIQELGPYEDGVSAEYEETVTLEANKVYCFEITDAWGDGIYSPRGNFTTHSSDGSLILQILDVADFGARCFVYTSKDVDAIRMVENDGLSDMDNVDVYSTDGHKVFSGKLTDIHLPAGCYILRDKESGAIVKKTIH